MNDFMILQSDSIELNWCQTRDGNCLCSIMKMSLGIIEFWKLIKHDISPVYTKNFINQWNMNIYDSVDYVSDIREGAKREKEDQKHELDTMKMK